MNLLLNAAQALHGRSGAGDRTIEVRVGTRGDQAVVAVSDTGPGVAPELTERIFDPYFTTKDSGSGLGLAIVRELLRQAGGRISLETHEGRGSTFSLTLPLVPGSASSPP